MLDFAVKPVGDCALSAEFAEEISVRVNQQVHALDELLRAAGLDRSLFCETAEPGRVVGNLSREAAAELGLTEAVALVAGGQDQTCAALGAGLIDESVGMDSHGTIEGIGVMSS